MKLDQLAFWGPTVIRLRAVVLFTMEDSSKVFAIGNIEQVAVADGTEDARRAPLAAPAQSTCASSP